MIRSAKAAPLTARELQRKLRELANPSDALILQRFFKTAPGEYGEGDVFLGIKVPPLRKLAKEAANLPLPEVEHLLRSKTHEERSLALMILVIQYTRGDAKTRERVYRFYLRCKIHINNWDLVDGSASYILGPHFIHRDPAPLRKLVKSPRLWDRRIAILTTFHFIRAGQFNLIIEFAAALLADPHDLMHKAIGWMLREVGKKNVGVLTDFLEQHAAEMPRTMLRYAIERLPAERKKTFLAKRSLQLNKILPRRHESHEVRNDLKAKNRSNHR